MPNAVSDGFTFHRSNIHEQRWLATFARLFPLLCFLGVGALAALGFAVSERFLLMLCAALNLCLCVAMSYFGACCLFGIHKVAQELQNEAVELVQEEGVQHVIVIANYKEDAQILSQTLTSMAQAVGSEAFHVVLAMEEREGDAAAAKVKMLTDNFGKHFASMTSTWHPANLSEVHVDGSSQPEIPGKASNLKQAVHDVYRQMMKDGQDASSVMLTVADADVLFHPRYFNYVAKDYNQLRQRGGDQHEWTIWQAPQLPFRNYSKCPAPSRVWGFVASMYEFGSVAGLSLGGDHFAFSTYSLPLRLAAEAGGHEGDVIAEDQHCTIRCFFYSVMKEAMRRSGQTSDIAAAGFGGKTSLRPVYLPVKATSVASETTWDGWKDRWLQAKRHSQGVAEVSCMVMIIADALRQLPSHLWTWQFTFSVFRKAARLFYVYILPACQVLALVFLGLHWASNDFQLDLCGPDTRDPWLCSLAGAYNPGWYGIPITVFLVSCGIGMVYVAFQSPLERGHFSNSIWTSEASALGLYPTCGSSFWTLTGWVLYDCLIFAGVLLLPYGVVTAILAFWNVAVRGNQFKYVPAAKGAATPKHETGTSIGHAQFITENSGKINDYYQLDKKKLGEGSGASVRKATNISTKAIRAVKTICKSQMNLERFKQEIAIIEMMDHPNIIKIFESFEDHRNIYLVMELCSGGELFDHIIESGHFSEVQASILMQQIIRAIHHMHENQVCHRDLKPENILFMTKDPIEKNCLKIIDFGLSCKFTPGKPLPTKTSTPYYAAPQVLAGNYDQLSDMWSCGVIMYVLLCGYPPFFGETDSEVLAKVRLGNFNFNPADWSHVSEDAKTLIRHLLKMHPKDRYTAEQALHHEWIKNKAPKASRVPFPSNFVDSLRRFRSQTDLKKAALRVIAGQLSENEIKALRDSFMALDKNSDGLLTPAELKQGLQKACLKEIPADLHQILEDVDADGSGVIDYSEFLAATLERRRYIQEEVCWSAFRAFDRNGNGRISQDELKMVLNNDEVEESLGHGMIMDLFKEVDCNCGRVIDFQEFLQMMRGRKVGLTARSNAV